MILSVSFLYSESTTYFLVVFAFMMGFGTGYISAMQDGKKQ